MENEMRAGGLMASDSGERWADVDARAPWALPDGGTVALATNVPGSGDYGDLRRSAQSVELDEVTSIRVAHPRRARGHPSLEGGIRA
jgi:hypothetical protein